jgi:rRNA maturation protein Nop10
MEYKYECPKCGGAGVMPVPFRFEMLLPFGETLTRNTRDAV